VIVYFRQDVFLSSHSLQSENIIRIRKTEGGVFVKLSNKTITILLGIMLLFFLTACSSGGDKTVVTVENSANQENESTGSGETTVANEETTAAAAESSWTTGVITGGIGLYEVHPFAGGLIGTDGMAVYFSSDGINWEMTLDLTPYPFYDAFLAGGQFAVFDANNSHFSSNGKDWTSAPRQDYHLFNTAMYDGSKFIDVDTGYLCTSSDGLKFVRYQAEVGNPLSEIYFKTASDYAASIYKLAQYNGTYYAVGDGIWSSSNLGTWTQVVTLEEMVYSATDMLYNGSTFFLPAGYDNFAFDGVKITSVKPGGSVFLVDSKSRFIALYGTGNANVSEDAITWEPLFTEDGVSFRAFCAAELNGQLFVYGEDGNMRYAKMFD